MANKTQANPAVKKYTKVGIIAAVVVVVAALGAWGISALRGNTVTVDEAMEVVTTDAANAADLRIAVLRMDAIQTDANVLKDLNKQRETYENELRDELEKKQKELEAEKSEIEKSQDVLSRDALQRRIADYQNRPGHYMCIGSNANAHPRPRMRRQRHSCHGRRSCYPGSRRKSVGTNRCLYGRNGKSGCRY